MKQSSSPLSFSLPYLSNLHALHIRKHNCQLIDILNTTSIFLFYHCEQALLSWKEWFTTELQPLFRISLPETLRHIVGQGIKNFTNVINLDWSKTTHSFIPWLTLVKQCDVHQQFTTYTACHAGRVQFKTTQNIQWNICPAGKLHGRWFSTKACVIITEAFNFTGRNESTHF